MPTPDNIVYYNGVPYISTAPAQNTNYQGAYTNGGMGLAGILAGQQRQAAQQAAMPVEQMIAKGLIKPVTPQAQAPLSAPRPATPLTPVPQAGWSPNGTGGKGLGLSDILNGPQYPKAPGQPAGGALPPAQPTPTPPPMGGGMPNPNAPQQNFDAMGKNIMAQVMARRGGA